MFSFVDMIGNYEERKVKNTKIDNGSVVDTCRVTDSTQPYETGICSPLYNNNKWIIVELYNTKKEAKKGHDKWVEKMKTPPKVLEDVSTSTISSFFDSEGRIFRKEED